MKSSFVAVCAALVSVGLLGACGGSSGGGGASFEDLGQQGSDIAARLTDMAPTEAMPVTDTASYRGVAAFGETPGVETPVALSRVQLTADFAEANISGVLDNFRADGVPASGRIDVTNGQITGNGFQADLAGAVSLAGDRAGITGTMSGEFVGADAGGVRGNMEAMADDDFTVFGVFGAERQ